MFPKTVEFAKSDAIRRLHLESILVCSALIYIVKYLTCWSLENWSCIGALLLPLWLDVNADRFRRDLGC